MRRLHDIPQEKREKTFFETLMGIPIPGWLLNWPPDNRMFYGSTGTPPILLDDGTYDYRPMYMRIDLANTYQPTYNISVA